MQQQFESESKTGKAKVGRSTPQTAPMAAHAAQETPLQSAKQETKAHQARVEELLRTIEHEAVKSKRKTKIILGIFGVFMLLMVVAAVGDFIRTGHFSLDSFKGLFGFIGMSSIAAGVTRQRKAATREIAQFEDKRAIGPMIDALGFGDLEVTAAVMPALTRQLPQLKASDAALLYADQRAALGRLLLTKNDTLPVKIPDFYAAILQALQQVGDEKSLPTVEKLAVGEGMAAYYPELKAQAKETLPFLQRRVEQARASQTLLRASAVDESSPETLLRAVAPTPPAEDPHQLLRADPY